MTERKRIVVDLQPVGRRVQIEREETLLEAAQIGGVELISLCGGVGACDSCKIRHVAGQLSPPTLEEEALFDREALAAGWRLACQARALSDVIVDIPSESLTTPQRLQLEGVSGKLALDPPVRACDIALPPPSLSDLRADAERLRDVLCAQGVAPVEIDLPILRALPAALRAQDWRVRIALNQMDGGRVVGVLPRAAPIYGCAIDIGTTSLAAYLVDLETGAIAAKAGAMNPQIAYGEDVIARISYLNGHPHNLNVLQTRLIEALNALIDRLCVEADVSRAALVDFVLAGNTAMHHLCAGLPVTQLGEAPYLPVVAGSLTYPAAHIGLRGSADAQVYMPPNIAGYVGADHVAMLTAIGAADGALAGRSNGEVVLAIDVGTNTEVSLITPEAHWCCSCASGPAFEGAHIRDGMRAAPGAIERVQLIEGNLRIKTIEDAPPVGICGSGILDAVAVMREAGVLEARGSLRAGHALAAPGDDGRPVFVLAAAADSGHGRAIAVSRKDVAEIQLAKAAIRTGIQILLDHAGIGIEAIDRFIIAGAFGSYIHVPSAIAIGMFPPLPLDRFEQVGNAAGMGARQLLLSARARAAAADLVRRARYVELTTEPNFQNVFVHFMALEAA